MNQKPYPSFGILLVDDEPAWLMSIAVTMERCCGVTNVISCQDSRQVMDILDRTDIGLILLDLVMPHMGGEELLPLIRERHPEIAVIVISGMNQLETAVRCVRMGAFDYYVKTDEEDRLMGGVTRAIRMIELEHENREMSQYILDGALKHPACFSGIVTGDRAMQSIFSYIEAVAQSPQPLMISGESGVGK